MSSSETYILTLQLDPQSLKWLQALRDRHFPPALNVVPAHLSLFHTLSLDQVLRLKEHWHQVDRSGCPAIRFTRVRSLGRGTAIVADAPTLNAIRERMIEVMSGSLSRQDSQVFNAHVTVQNKVDPSAARSLFDMLSSEFVVRHGTGLGVIVWKYLSGPWLQTDVLSFKVSTLESRDR